MEVAREALERLGQRLAEIPARIEASACVALIFVSSQQHTG